MTSILRQAVKRWRLGGPAAVVVQRDGHRRGTLEAPVARADESSLARALSEGRSVITVELEPPKGHDASATLAEVRRLAAHGIDAVTVSDGVKGGARVERCRSPCW